MPPDDDAQLPDRHPKGREKAKQQQESKGPDRQHPYGQDR